MNRRKYIDRAIQMYEDEGTLEFDDKPIVSDSEGGAYVQAWVWVSADDIEE